MEPSITPLGSGNNHSMYNNLNSHHLSGSRGGQHHQDDAIVPASDDEHQDESTDEDEDEYNSYLHEQEQKQHRQDISLEDEYLHRQQQQHLHAYKSQAMNIQQLLRHDQLQQEHDENGDMDLDSDDEFEHHDDHDHDHDQYNHDHERQDTLLDDEDDDSFDDERGPEDALDEMMEEDEEEDDEGSETISLTEDDIDFNLVYAFHTFVATQEGQASVVRNDSLMLLEDTNVYWWLVRVLKTGVIGYIPAENIEVRILLSLTLTPSLVSLPVLLCVSACLGQPCSCARLCMALLFPLCYFYFSCFAMDSTIDFFGTKERQQTKNSELGIARPNRPTDQQREKTESQP